MEITREHELYLSNELEEDISEEFYSPEELSEQDINSLEDFENGVQDRTNSPLKFDFPHLSETTHSASKTQSNTSNIDLIEGCVPKTYESNNTKKDPTSENAQAKTEKKSISKVENQILNIKRQNSQDITLKTSKFLPERRRSARLMKSSNKTETNLDTSQDTNKQDQDHSPTKKVRLASEGPRNLKKSIKMNSRPIPHHNSQKSTLIATKRMYPLQTSSSILFRRRLSLDDANHEHESFKRLNQSSQISLDNNENQAPFFFENNNDLEPYNQYEISSYGTPNSSYFAFKNLSHEKMIRDDTEIQLFPTSLSDPEQLKFPEKSSDLIDNSYTTRSAGWYDVTPEDNSPYYEMDVTIIFIPNYDEQELFKPREAESISTLSQHSSIDEHKINNTTGQKDIDDNDFNITKIGLQEERTDRYSIPYQPDIEQVLSPMNSNYARHNSRRSFHTSSFLTNPSLSASTLSPQPSSTPNLAILESPIYNKTSKTRESYGARRISDYTSRLNRTSYSTSDLQLSTENNSLHSTIQSEEKENPVNFNMLEEESTIFEKSIPLFSVKSSLMSTLAELRVNITEKIDPPCLSNLSSKIDSDSDVITRWQATQFAFSLSLDGQKPLERNQEESTYGFNLSSTNKIRPGYTILSNTGDYYIYLIPNI